MAMLLIKAGARLNVQNVYGYDILHAAARAQKKSLFRRILSLNNENRNLYVINFTQKSEYNRTLLHTLSFHGYSDLIELLPEDVIQTLINHKTSSDHQSITALHNASMQGNSDMIKWLLAHDADPSLRNSENETPLMTAVLCHQEKAIKCFYELGIQLSDTDQTTLLEDPKYKRQRDPIMALLASIELTMTSLPITALQQQIKVEIDQLDNDDIATSSADAQINAALLSEKIDKLRSEMQQQIDEFSRLHKELSQQYINVKTERSSNDSTDSSAPLIDLTEPLFRAFKEELKDRFLPLIPEYYGSENQDTLLREHSQLRIFSQEVERRLCSRLMSAFSLVSGLIAREQTKTDKFGKHSSAIARGICQAVPFLGGLVGELVSVPVNHSIRSYKSAQQKKKYEAVIESFANGHELLLFSGIVARRLTLRDQVNLLGYPEHEAKVLGQLTARQLYGVIKTGGLVDLAGSSLSERVDCLLQNFTAIAPFRKISPEKRARTLVDLTFENALKASLTEPAQPPATPSTQPQTLFYTRLGSRDSLDTELSIEITVEDVSLPSTP